jgi:hypothetical protein
VGGKDGAKRGLGQPPAGSPRVQPGPSDSNPDNAREHFEVAIADDLSGVRQQLISADWHGGWRAELSRFQSLLPLIGLYGFSGRGSQTVSFQGFLYLAESSLLACFVAFQFLGLCIPEYVAFVR